jgi:hypothetical protein
MIEVARLPEQPSGINESPSRRVGRILSCEKAAKPGGMNQAMLRFNRLE